MFECLIYTYFKEGDLLITFILSYNNLNIELYIILIIIMVFTLSFDENGEVTLKYFSQKIHDAYRKQRNEYQRNYKREKTINKRIAKFLYLISIY